MAAIQITAAITEVNSGSEKTLSKSPPAIRDAPLLPDTCIPPREELYGARNNREEAKRKKSHAPLLIRHASSASSATCYIFGGAHYQTSFHRTSKGIWLTRLNNYAFKYVPHFLSLLSSLILISLLFLFSWSTVYIILGSGAISAPLSTVYLLLYDPYANCIFRDERSTLLHICLIPLISVELFLSYWSVSSGVSCPASSKM